MSTELLKPLENIFPSSRSNERRKAVIVFTLSAIFIIFYLGLELEALILAILTVLAIIYFRSRSSALNIEKEENNSTHFYKISSDFSWEDSKEQAWRNLTNLTSLCSYIGVNFTVVSYPDNSNSSMRPISVAHADYLNFIDSTFPERHSFSSVIKLENVDELSIGRIKESVSRIGISMEESSKFILTSAEFFFGEKDLKLDGKYISGKFHYCVLALKNIKGGKYFQLSDIVRRIRGDVLFVNDFRMMDSQNSLVIRRQISTILASSKIKTEKKIALKNSFKDREESAIILKKTDENEIIDTSMFLIIKADAPYELTDKLIHAKSLTEHFSLETQVVNDRKTIEKLISMNFSSFHYPMLSGNIASLISFLGTKVKTNGIIIGKNSMTGMSVHLDIFSGDSYNLIILGETGSGKTFFSRLVLWRLLISGMVEKIMIIDPQDEFSSISFADRMGAGTEYFPEIKILTGYGDNYLRQMEEYITGDSSKRKMILVDEAHLFIRDQESKNKMSYLYRVSRHYNASIMIITQDVEDFKQPPLNSIINNSAYVGIFRNKMWDSLKEFGISPQKHGYSNFESLGGGKSSTESEMFLYTNGRMKKVSVLASGWELSNL